MSQPTIKVKVVDAGSIPLTTWNHRRGCWSLVKGEPGIDDTPPRVLLEMSEADARRLAGRLGEEIVVEIKGEDTP